ncbi:MAG TPA: PAS domain-containing protein, partial [Phenylobacterium sp.]|nr:PAS domain-containing protein [Phenylobacterium sp.]
MAGDQTPAPLGQEGPFGLGLTQAACDRATRLARTLFPGADAQVVLQQDGQIWRSRMGLGHAVDDVAARIAMETGELVWVEDGRLDPRFAENPLVVGPPGLRFYAGAPLQLANGETPGVLAVYGSEPRAYDATLAARLEDLAAFVADEWVRSQADLAREQNRRERDAVTETLNSVLRVAPVFLVLMDREMRVLGCSGRWAEQFGLTAETAQGLTLGEIAPSRFDRWRPFYDRCLAGETIRAPQFAYERPDGETGWLSAELTPWRDANGEIGGILVGSHDI